MIRVEETIRSVLAQGPLPAERWQSGAAYNPLSARMARDPYPVYARMRGRGPAHRSRLANAWVFTRHRDVDAMQLCGMRSHSQVVRRSIPSGSR